MKKTIIYTLIILQGLAFISCEDVLNKPPYQQISKEKVYQTINDYENGLNGVYAGARATYFGGSHYIVPEAMTDNMISCSEGRGTLSQTHEWIFTSAGEFSGLWSGPYYVIRAANEVITRLQDTTIWNSSDDAEQFYKLYGEALAMRAMAHFDLVRYFGKSYNEASETDLGIPYVTEASKDDRARNTVRECYDFIIADLEQAEQYLTNHLAGEESTWRQENIYITLPVIHGLLSRVYLTMEDWQKVIEYSTLAIDNANALLGEAGRIASLQDFPGVWTDASESGVMFKIKFTNIDGAIGTLFNQTGLDGTRSEFVCSKELDSLFQNNDVRYSSYIFQGQFNGKMFNHINKYRQRTGEDRTELVDFKVLRIEELYLSRAEAYSNLNTPDDDLARADVNAVREERYSAYDPGIATGQELKNLIQLERRLEFAFEGLRWFDLKRRNMDVVRLDYGDEADGGGVHNINLILDKDNFRWELPIPIYEMDANDLINSEHQNPGYGS